MRKIRAMVQECADYLCVEESDLYCTAMTFVVVLGVLIYFMPW